MTVLTFSVKMLKLNLLICCFSQVRQPQFGRFESRRFVQFDSSEYLSSAADHRRRPSNAIFDAARKFQLKQQQRERLTEDPTRAHTRALAGVLPIFKREKCEDRITHILYISHQCVREKSQDVRGIEYGFVCVRKSKRV